jgi:hypothetical protein
MAENQKEKLMSVFGLTEQEAEELIAYDKAVDRGEKTPYDLTPEQEKVAKKMRGVGTRSHAQTGTYNFTKRNRKENPTKASIISEIARFLTENGYEMVEITNKERQIALKVGENAFELTLVQKRTPKK